MQTILDLHTFPLDQPESTAYHDLVKRCKTELARDGMFNLNGFLHEDIATDTVIRLAKRFENDAFEHARTHNIYFKDDIPGLPADHPARRKVTTSNHTLCADQAMDTALARLYDWPPFLAFLAETMDLPRLYAMDDALACWNVMRYGEGQGLNWHFDRSEFTTTLLLQAPDDGGAFEYRSNLRNESDPNFAGVGDLLEGRDPKVREISLRPGTLNVFRGKNTAHRVTPVKGAVHRVIAVLAYYETPGVAFSEEERLGFYGRTGPDRAG